VRTYADSSFVLRLVTGEATSSETIAKYRWLGSPKLFFLTLHALEVRNAILLRTFHQRRSASAGERRHIARERDTALSRLDHLVARRALLELSLDMDTAIARAIQLSTARGERLGTRAIDLLHVASALTLESELFLTTDFRQAQLAKVEGLKVVSVG
jgi:predicted nucleic acid-binding protein